MKAENSKILINIFVSHNDELGCVNDDSLRELLVNTKIEDIFTLIKNNCDRLNPISAANIPQYSNIDEIPKVINIVKNATDLHDYADIGHFLISVDAKKEAKRKYGENHYKLTAQLGLTAFQTRCFELTPLGEMYYNEKDPKVRRQLEKKLSLRIPIVQQAFIEAESGICDLRKMMSMYLSEATCNRRRSNVMKLISEIGEMSSSEMQHLVNRIVWKK